MRVRIDWLKPCFYQGPLILAMLLLLPIVWPQEKILPPPDGVVHDGIPPVPSSINVETNPYRTGPGSSLIGWDPEKPQMLVNSVAWGIRAARRVEGPGKQPVLIMKLPDWDRDVIFSPNGDYLIYMKPADDNFQDQIYRYDLETKKTTQLTDGKSKNRQVAPSPAI